MLTVINPPSDKAIPADLLEMMRAFDRFGRVTLMHGGNGWWCYIEMNTNTTGVTFSVKGDSNHTDPYLAARQCWERMHGALKALT